jgi:dTMP kinase
MDCINKFALKPDLTLFLDIPPDVAIGRLKRKRSVMETLRNLVKVRDGYLSLVQQQRMVALDGNKSIDEIARDILEAVLKELEN